MTVEEWLGKDNTLGIDIWKNKYQFEGETFDHWLDRVSGGDDEVRDLIIEKKFLFGAIGGLIRMVEKLVLVIVM